MTGGITRPVYAYKIGNDESGQELSVTPREPDFIIARPPDFA